MERIWLKSYPPGVPADVDWRQYASVAQMFDEAVRRHGDRPAFENMGRELSYSALDACSRRFAAWLQQR